MNNAIDLEARQDINKVLLYARDIGAAVWGDDERRDNGLRSRVNGHDEALKELNDNLESLRSDVTRIAGTSVKEDTAVKVADISASVEKEKIKWKEIGKVAAAFLVLAGTIFSSYTNMVTAEKVASLQQGSVQVRPLHQGANE